ncbi:uncharacterized protein LOC111864597 isoform X2 [Cryptotermes secundus]|uniref:uncharacterized protein LOC111864597 isoform X2 n=1 Tax=Cryptotermes secundus TaxID=105785 RepID=UPI000CD7DB44|nr:uncharacterized protein LOC111864597 isoform X2 [Cryptotermes secundus]
MLITRRMIYMLYPLFRLVFGTLYPAYASYKAVRTKNVKEYVKWMMYWIVFALFTCAETFTDMFLSFWFPFYYEIKIILVLWLLSPATKGSSILYRKFVHPMLSRREQEIDEYIAKAKEQGYHTVLHLGTKGVNYATTVLMQTAIKGGGGLVNQIRRSYSLSDLSSDKESDMNCNTKALQNVSDEDDMEETDGLDPRMLKPRGYSPRRSASGSSRMEMYFPEVDVDVRQHGSTRPREPSIPLSHIRSSEDVSSGYSSAEPLYAGHHAAKSEGLAASREPLVRTASVGSTRSMRTKSSRGGVVAKRGPASEDSELLDIQGDEGDYSYQEECFYDVSSSLSSHASMSVPFPITVTVNRSAAPPFPFLELSYPSAQKQVVAVPSKLNDMSSQEQCIDDSDVKSDSPDDEDTPLYDAESDESKLPDNECLLTEPLDSLVKDDIISTSYHETSLSCDVTLLQLDRTANGLIPDTVVSSVGPILSNECLTSHLNITSNNIILGTSTAHADETNKDEALTKNKNEIPVQKESPIINVRDLPCEPAILQHAETEPRNLITGKVDILSDSLEGKTQNMDVAIDSLKDVKPFSLAQPTHTPLEVAEALDMTSGFSEVVSKPVGIEEPSVSFLEEVNNVIDDTVSETLTAVGISGRTPTSAEFHSLDKMADISSESQNSKCDTDIKHSNNYDDNKSDLNFGLAATEKSATGIMHSAEHDTSKLNSNSVISAGVNGLDEILQVENSDENPLQDQRGSPYTSVESLSPPEPASRSSSQGSLRKDGRAGRYHKRPAPTPPPKNSESEGEDWTEVQEPQMLCDGNSKALTCHKELNEHVPSPKEVRFEDSESAVTARLVLKPGVMRSLGPDSGTKAEVFVSRTPQIKSKKLNSKSKQGDSALSRLIGLPKNQFGNLTSYFPFWHGKQEAHASADIQSLSPGSSKLQSSSNSASVAVHESTSSCSKRHNSSQSSDINVKVMSYSPGQRRQAPLADWE